MSIEYSDKSPDLFDGLDSPRFERAFSEKVKPSLVNDTSTDMGFNLLANQLKVDVRAVESPALVAAKEDRRPETIIEEEPSHYRTRRTSPSSTSSSSSSSSSSTTVVQKKKKLSGSDARLRKIELLRTFQEMEEKKIRVSTRYTIHSDLDEMEQEYEVLRSLQMKKNAIGLYRGFMMNAVQALEYINESYNPFDFQLRGWSEHLSLGIDDYTDVFGELYEKYKHTGRKMEPELKLLIMVTASATTFHASQTFLRSDDSSSFLRSNPRVVNRIAKEMVKERPVGEVFESDNNMRGPDPKAFLAQMRERVGSTEARQQHFIPSTVVVDTNPLSENSVSATTTTRRKKKNSVTIQI